MSFPLRFSSFFLQIICGEFDCDFIWPSFLVFDHFVCGCDSMCTCVLSVVFECFNNIENYEKLTVRLKKSCLIIKFFMVLIFYISE